MRGARLETAVFPLLHVTEQPEQLSTAATRQELTPLAAPGGGAELPSNCHRHFAPEGATVAIGPGHSGLALGLAAVAAAYRAALAIPNVPDSVRARLRRPYHHNLRGGGGAAAGEAASVCPVNSSSSRLEASINPRRGFFAHQLFNHSAFDGAEEVCSAFA